jgi:hemolysin III
MRVNVRTAVPGMDRAAIAAMAERAQTLGEEIANSVSHGIGLLGAMVAMPFLLVGTIERGSVASVVGASVFAAAVLLLYAASTLYHALPGRRAKALFRKLDHGAIFLLIAGTYTPFTLGALAGPWGWTLFGLVWGLAAIGITLKACDRMAHPTASTALYVAMGWLAVIALPELIERIPGPGLVLLAAGGLAYTVGIAFFATDSRVRYGHFLWHLFVLAGTACHFGAVLGFAG